MFTVMLVASLVLLFNKDYIEAWAKHLFEKAKEDHPDDAQKYEYFVDQLTAQIENVSYALLVFTSILCISFMCGFLYLRSTQDKTFDNKQKLLSKKDLEKS